MEASPGRTLTTGVVILGASPGARLPGFATNNFIIRLTQLALDSLPFLSMSVIIC